MQKDQDIIYFLAGENREELDKSPLLQKVKKRDIEVLLLDDPIDEFCMQNLAEYEKKKVQNIAKGDLKLGGEDDDAKVLEKRLKKAFEPLTKWWKKKLDKEVDKVIITQRLTDAPCAIVASEYGYSASMARINKAQAFSNPEKAPRYIIYINIIYIYYVATWTQRRHWN